MLRKIPFSVPANALNEAINSLPQVNFRLSLNNPTDRFFYDPWVIKDEFKNTIWEKILNTLPGPIGEARIIQLTHGTCYMSHCDIDDRYHLNIQGQYSFLIDIDSQEMFSTVADGNWYFINTGVRHVAANFGSIDRIQLVVRKLLNDPELESPVAVKITPTCVNPRFEFDDVISPWLHKMNKLSLLKDFTVYDDSVSFKLSNSQILDLELFPKEKFKIAVEK